MPKATYSNCSIYNYEVNKLFNKDNDMVDIKLVNMIQHKNKKYLFILKNEDLLGFYLY